MIWGHSLGFCERNWLLIMLVRIFPLCPSIIHIIWPTAMGKPHAQSKFNRNTQKSDTYIYTTTPINKLSTIIYSWLRAEFTFMTQIRLRFLSQLAHKTKNSGVLKIHNSLDIKLVKALPAEICPKWSMVVISLIWSWKKN